MRKTSNETAKSSKEGHSGFTLGLFREAGKAQIDKINKNLW
jgi:hypothetical protein